MTYNVSSGMLNTTVGQLCEPVNLHDIAVSEYKDVTIVGG